MQIRIRLNSRSRQSLVERLQQAYAGGHLRLVKRIHALLKYFPEFAALIQKVDGALQHFAKTPDEIPSLMGLYHKLLGAASQNRPESSSELL